MTPSISALDPPKTIARRQLAARLIAVLGVYAARQATAYRGLTSVRVIDETGTLDGEDVLPGFSCPLAEILDPREA